MDTRCTPGVASRHPRSPSHCVQVWGCYIPGCANVHLSRNLMNSFPMDSKMTNCRQLNETSMKKKQNTCLNILFYCLVIYLFILDTVYLDRDLCYTV